VLEAVLEAADYVNAPVEYDASKPTMIPKRMIDINRIRGLTGWVPQTSMAAGIQKTVDWYRTTYATRTPEEVIL
jgi:GDP-L-fucose synthase